MTPVLPGSGPGWDEGGADAVRTLIAGYSAEALSNALNGLTGGGFEVAPLEGQEPERREVTREEYSLVWWQAISVASGALVWLVAGKDLWNAVGQMVLGGEGAEAAASEEDCRATWNEVAGQTMGGIARYLSGELKREVQAQEGALESQALDGQTDGIAVRVRHSSGNWRVQVRWNRQFAGGCVVPTAAPVPGKSVAERPGTGGLEAITSRTLDLLMDVALPVSVSFGRTSLQVREVLKLNTGSVVELDRLVSEPVEVIVNNCVIARGEVVVVDGNYGVRVIHLASRADRLRTGVSEASTRLGAGLR
jgi:flagellar motor switch protein FliN/FliY